MTVNEAAKALKLEVLTCQNQVEREIESVYCCDLLSFVMGRAPANSAWVTVMGNVNAIAVAMLCDVACVVLAENAVLDEEAKPKAEQNEIVVLRSSLPVFETATAIARELVP
ncbi:DRTGG domain-containing protein [Oscillospiraceae bacterium PP1C4]